MTSKSIEIMVASHKIASERRQKGKPIWDRSIDIRSIINRDNSRVDNEYVVSIANEIGLLLRSRLPKELFDCCSESYDLRLDEAVVGLSEMSLSDFEEGQYLAVDELNGWLGDIYDWADLNRVWLGR